MAAAAAAAAARTAGQASTSARGPAGRVRGGGSLSAAAPPHLPSPSSAFQPRPGRPHHSSSARASWVDYLPRIVDSFSRRVPPPSDAPATPSSLPLTLPSATDAADAARRLFFPESLADPATLTVPVLIFGALAVGVGVELASLALRALPGEDGGGDGSGAGAGGATTTAEEEEEEEGERGVAAAPADPAAAPFSSPAAADRVMGERYRGLAWLAGAAGLALYSAGLLTGSDKPLQP